MVLNESLKTYKLSILEREVQKYNTTINSILKFCIKWHLFIFLLYQFAMFVLYNKHSEQSELYVKAVFFSF